VIAGAILFSPWNLPVFVEVLMFSALALFGLVLSYNILDPKIPEGPSKVTSYFEGFLFFGVIVFALVDWFFSKTPFLAIILLSLIASAYFRIKTLKRVDRVKMLTDEEIKQSRAAFHVRLERIRRTSKRIEKEINRRELLQIKKSRSAKDDDSPPPAA